MKKITALMLAVLLVLGMTACNKPETQKEVADPVAVTAPEIFHTNAHGYESWSVHYRNGEDGQLQYYYLDETGTEITVSAEEAQALLDTQVATCGDRTLDNGMLQVYYAEREYNITNAYSSYLMYLMDTEAPLDSQLDDVLGDGTGTWQKSFLENSLESFKATAALLQQAQAEGFTLTEEQQANLEQYCDLEAMAPAYGMADAKALVEAMFGPIITVEDYQQYMNDNITVNYYLEHLAQDIQITDEEIEAYFEANQEAFEASNISKDTIDVRHILVQPIAAEDGSISETAWADALAEAERILAEYEAGEKTEEAFGVLAGDYTADPGSAETGGLYEGVYPGQMVAEFNDWCFDETRQIGDTGIVKTSYGYHIMYFVGQSQYWRQVCGEEITTERLMQMRDEILAQYDTSVDMNKIAIFDDLEATRPAATQETVTEEIALPTEETEESAEETETSEEVVSAEPSTEATQP